MVLQLKQCNAKVNHYHQNQDGFHKFLHNRTKIARIIPCRLVQYCDFMEEGNGSDSNKVTFGIAATEVRVPLKAQLVLLLFIFLHNSISVGMYPQGVSNTSSSLINRGSYKNQESPELDKTQIFLFLCSLYKVHWSERLLSCLSALILPDQSEHNLINPVRYSSEHSKHNSEQQPRAGTEGLGQQRREHRDQWGIKTDIKREDMYWIS